LHLLGNITAHNFDNSTAPPLIWLLFGEFVVE
jgi:hypothetical protein